MTPILFVWGDRADYANYCRAVEAAGGAILFSREIQAAIGCDGLLLPGGGDLAPWRYGQGDCGSRRGDVTRDEAELTLAAQFAALNKPILGICRGMQLLNVYFGGTLLQDIPGHNARDGEDSLHTAKAAPSFLTALYGAEHVINSAHHQAVDRLGGGLQAVQWAQDGVVEALCHETLPVWGVQWHPERLCGPLARAGAVDGSGVFHWFLKNL
ncbi:MAG: gamma-glutamyl-gamma-aminobutyrate hydrolase family protein [Oscillibacter sp.]